MKWSNKQKEKLKELCFAEKSNKEISEIMGISLNDVYAGRSRFGITIAKVEELKMNVGVTKEEFIKKYAELLRMTRENIADLELADIDTVVIKYVDGYKQPVNIACDSAMGIIRDVARAID